MELSKHPTSYVIKLSFRKHDVMRYRRFFATSFVYIFHITCNFNVCLSKMSSFVTPLQLPEIIKYDSFVSFIRIFYTPKTRIFYGVIFVSRHCFPLSEHI